MTAQDHIATSAEVFEQSALACAHAVHTGDGAPTPELLPLPPALRRVAQADKSPAQWAYERLALYLRDFEDRLKDSEEVALGLTGGAQGVLRIEGLGYFAPDLLTFYGRSETGERVQLIQHVTQLNLSLVALPRPEPEAPARRIGFRLFEDLGAQEAAQEAAATGAGQDARQGTGEGTGQGTGERGAKGA